jgi:hypothetical protein
MAEPTKPTTPGALERFARSFIEKRLGEPAPNASNDPIHVLSQSERSQINGIVSGTMWRSATMGVLSAGACVAVEIIDPGASSLAKLLWMIIVSAISAVAEVAYLYWKHLDAVSALARVTGANLFSGREVRGELVAAALARAALELPDPLDVVPGVDPRRDSPKWLLFLGGLVYKLKYSATNFLFKLLVRRLLARSLLRVFAPLVALPLAAFWNAYVSYRVLREARIRAVGPSAIAEMTSAFLDARPAPSPALREAILRGAAVAMVRKRDAHPNLVVLFRSLELRFGAATGIEVLDDPQRFAAQVAGLPTKDERDTALTVFQVASILDGRLTRGEREFISALRQQSGLSADIRLLEGLLQFFVRGLPIHAKLIEVL